MTMSADVKRSALLNLDAELEGPWEKLMRQRCPKSFFYLFAFRDESDAPVDLRCPFRTTDGLRTWRPKGKPIDDLHIGTDMFVVGAEVDARRPAWEAVPSCLLLSVLRDNGLEPEVVFFRLEEWRRIHVSGSEAA